MPIGIQRLNARRSQPNDHIVFIKPLKGPDEVLARDFLERIAAQCLPLMREQHLSVMALEEYAPNASFVGRNFNAGEVIQLVLKTRHTGQWLPFGYVQMVMMHELAHCRHMHHGRAFWAMRDAYAARMRRLWADGYTGEGIWGRGAALGVGGGDEWAAAVAQNTARANGDDVLQEHLCGGTYRSRRAAGAKRKPALTYREQQERRIRRRFGENGLSLGGDVAERARLEGGGGGGSSVSVPANVPANGRASQKRSAVKPRVAKSKRGRDLRAAAALARFDQAQTVQGKDVKDEDLEDEDDALAALKQEEDVSEEDADQSTEDAVDIDGVRLVDAQGRGMVRVCEDERADDDDARREMQELLAVGSDGQPPRQMRPEPAERQPPPGAATPKREAGVKSEQTERPLRDIPDRQVKQEALEDLTRQPVKQEPPRDSKHDVKRDVKQHVQKKYDPGRDHNDDEPEQRLMDIPAAPTVPPPNACPLCSLENLPLAVTCAMCANVLLPDADPRAWTCRRVACPSALSGYRNAGDCGVCGVCGQRP